MSLFTPPLTPCTPASHASFTKSPLPNSFNMEGELPDAFALPPPMSSAPAQASFGQAEKPALSEAEKEKLRLEGETYAWRPHMTPDERVARQNWLSEGRGRSGLRIVIVTENFLPKVDGVTRTLARLLEHLTREGHQCMLLGPGSGMDSYAGHPLVGTAGVPLVVYPGLKLNFLRPKFLNTIKRFQPDVIHFVDPIWLGAQTLMAMELGWAGEEWVAEGGPAIGTGVKGAVVASYHTNLATYATLFGMPRLEPILWRFQQWLYSKTRLTMCPSPSTRAMLHANDFDQVRLWPRGVDLSQFCPSKRSAAMRASWGVGPCPYAPVAPSQRAVLGLGKPSALRVDDQVGVHYQGRKASLPLTPPESPAVGPLPASQPNLASIDEVLSLSAEPQGDTALPERVVLMFVGRISWEKNIHLLLAAYSHLPTLLPRETLVPKLVFVGDGPARAELEGICQRKGYDAVFMGQRVGEDLAQCFASADVFAFPSFTETFGQVVLEALASGLPVVGLNAEGTRDLVSDGQTGLLLRLPAGCKSWPTALKCTSSATHAAAANDYAGLLVQAVCDHALRERMGRAASTEGIRGFTWWDAMERCVDGYREALRDTIVPAASESEQVDTVVPTPTSPRISRVNRVLSKRLAHRGAWDTDAQSVKGCAMSTVRVDTCETIWHLKNVLKLLVMLLTCWAIYSRHLSATSAAKELAAT